MNCNGGTGSVLGRYALDLEDKSYQYGRSGQAENEESCINRFQTHFDKIHHQSDGKEDHTSHYHPFASSEVSETHPDKSSYCKADEVRRALESYGGVRVAEQLRHLRYEIVPS